MSTHRERFSTIYLSQLDYFTTSGALPPFASGKREAMLAGILDGSAIIDGPACKATCRALGIKNTYKAIREFLARDKLA